MNCAVEWFVYATVLSRWCCHEHEFNKWVFVQYKSLWFSIVATRLHYVSLTGNVRKGVVKLNWVAKWVAAWRRLKTTVAEKKHGFILQDRLQKPHEPCILGSPIHTVTMEAPCGSARNAALDRTCARLSVGRELRLRVGGVWRSVTQRQDVI